MSDAPTRVREATARRRRLVGILSTLAVFLLALVIGSIERRIDLAPEALLRPLEQTPPAGFRAVSLEHSDSEEEFVWRLALDPVADDYDFLVVDVGVAPPGRWYSPKCEWIGRELPLATESLAAPQSKEASAACRFTFPGEWRVITYQIVTRNALVHVQTAVTPRVDDATALALIVSVARTQIDLIERLAPRRWWVQPASD